MFSMRRIKCNGLCVCASSVKVLEFEAFATHVLCNNYFNFSLFFFW